MDTGPSTYYLLVRKKQRKQIQIHICPLIIFSPSAQVFLACGMRALILLNPLKPHAKIVKIHKNVITLFLAVCTEEKKENQILVEKTKCSEGL